MLFNFTTWLPEAFLNKEYLTRDVIAGITIAMIIIPQSMAYATLAALIARTIIFSVGALSEASYLSRIIVVLLSLGIFYTTKKNFVYPTVFSALCMAFLNNLI